MLGKLPNFRNVSIALAILLATTASDRAFQQQIESGKPRAYKEMLLDLWHHHDPQQDQAFFYYRHAWINSTQPQLLKKVARTIKERLANAVTHCAHKINNDAPEKKTIMCIQRRKGAFGNLNLKKSTTAIDLK